MDPRIAELLERTYQQGTIVTNCLIHAGLKVDARPQTCTPCWYDLRNLLERALAANRWLNDWKDAAEPLLRGGAPTL